VRRFAAPELLPLPRYFPRKLRQGWSARRVGVRGFPGLKIQTWATRRLEEDFETKSVIQEDRIKIKELFEIGKMDNAEIKDRCVSLRDYMAELFESWSDSNMQHLTLTSVGIAIGHANIKRIVGEFSNLSIWIN
jgi:hypothetical protein